MVTAKLDSFMHKFAMPVTYIHGFILIPWKLWRESITQNMLQYKCWDYKFKGLNSKVNDATTPGLM